MGDKTPDEWIADYSEGHQHWFNQLTHLVGIPMIVLALPLFVLSAFFSAVWPFATGLFVTGWILQFAGHAVEGKPPEFFKNWRFLFVGVTWWAAKVRQRFWQGGPAG